MGSGYYVLPILRGDRLVGRVEPSSTGGLAAWLGAATVVWDSAPPRLWVDAART